MRRFVDKCYKILANNSRNCLGIFSACFLFILYLYWTTIDQENNKLTNSAKIASKRIHPNRMKSGTFLKTEEQYGLITDTMLECFVNTKDHRRFLDGDTNQAQSPDLPTIYFVTPTYPRREQMAELTRLGQTLMHVRNLHWIVADDNQQCNNQLDNLLLDFGIPYTHLSSPMPEVFRIKKTIPRGVSNRRAALQWIKNNNIRSGVLYFGDDDNTFSLKLFSEIRETKVVTMFPVGLIGEYSISSPIVKEGKVVGFFDSWPAKRLWPVDMAGFAVNLAYMAQQPNVTMPYKAGHEEDEFLKSINLTIDQIEPKANDCTEVLVWHTRTVKTKPPMLKIEDDILFSDTTSLGTLLRTLDAMGVSFPNPSKGIRTEVSKDRKSKPASSLLNLN